MKKSKSENIVAICEGLFKTAQKAKKYRKSLQGENFYARKFFGLRKNGTLALRELITRIKSAKNTKLLKNAKGINNFMRVCLNYETSLSDKKQALDNLKFIYQTEIEPNLKFARATIVSDHLFPAELISGTKSYLEKISEQARGCYDFSWYDACAVMIRRLIESLIIEIYESANITRDIKDKNGNFLMLDDLIDIFLIDSRWNPSRTTKSVLPKIKKIGNWSAHNRFYIAKKPDVDNISDDLRVAIEELINFAGLK